MWSVPYIAKIIQKQKVMNYACNFYFRIHLEGGTFVLLILTVAESQSDLRICPLTFLVFVVKPLYSAPILFGMKRLVSYTPCPSDFREKLNRLRARSTNDHTKVVWRK